MFIDRTLQANCGDVLMCKAQKVMSENIYLMQNHPIKTVSQYNFFGRHKKVVYIGLSAFTLHNQPAIFSLNVLQVYL